MFAYAFLCFFHEFVLEIFIYMHIHLWYSYMISKSEGWVFIGSKKDKMIEWHVRLSQKFIYFSSVYSIPRWKYYIVLCHLIIFLVKIFYNQPWLLFNNTLRSVSHKCFWTFFEYFDIFSPLYTLVVDSSWHL